MHKEIKDVYGNTIALMDSDDDTMKINNILKEHIRIFKDENSVLNGNSIFQMMCEHYQEKNISFVKDFIKLNSFDIQDVQMGDIRTLISHFEIGIFKFEVIGFVVDGTIKEIEFNTYNENYESVFGDYKFTYFSPFNYYLKEKQNV